MPTVGADIVKAALLKSGVTAKSRNPDSFDLTNGLSDLNDMIALWNFKRWMHWSLLDLAKVSNGRTTPYTIGPAQDFITPIRPSRIKAAYVKQLGQTSGLPVNTPLVVIEAREQWSRLSVPTLISFPKNVFLDTAWPNGNVNIYPWPNANIYEIHLIVDNPISSVDAATDMSFLPPHYIPAFKFNLALVFRQAYGRSAMRPDPELNKFAKMYLDGVKESNLQIPELVMPKLLTTQTSGYNILSDQFGTT